ncbi:MAG: acetylglutamate kinase [Chloroflexota bacterium]|nr:acetylglutamate kinase [Chloroflexota bacterium]
MATNTPNPIVIKIGGSTLGNHDTTLEDLATLQKRGVPLVVVHGGANRVTEWLKRQGTPTSFIDGLRVTDDKSLEMVAAVLGGLVNTELVADINSLGGRVIGMTGVDGNLLECTISNPKLGFAGKITKVNPEGIQAILDAGFIPLVAPPGAKSPLETADIPYVNINGDDVAGELAAALRAERLVFLTDVEGIRDADGQLISGLTATEVKVLMSSGVIAGGMIPKAKAALIALKTTPIIQIIDGRVPHALLDSIEAKTGGTVIT